MTLILSVCTREGIHLFSDSLITMADGSKKYISKIKTYENKFAISFYGDMERNSRNYIFEDIDNFINTAPSQLTFSEFLYRFKSKFCDQLDLRWFKTGFHISGYNNDILELWHLFYEYEITNGTGYIFENSNSEIYTSKLDGNYDIGTCMPVPYKNTVKYNYSLVNGFSKLILKERKDNPVRYNGANRLFHKRYKNKLIPEFYDQLSEIEAKNNLLKMFEEFIITNKNNSNVAVDFPIYYVFIGKNGKFNSEKIGEVIE